MTIVRLWEDKNEDDILECIKEGWQNLGFHSIVNFHKYDRRHEDGVDLSCEDSGQTIHLQAKMKPLQKDIAQMKKLSRSSANKKIYVYVCQPSKPFADEMKRLSALIDFWDSGKLHNYLIASRCQLYLRYMFLDSDLVRDIYNILIKLFESSRIKPLKLDFSILNDWWNLKDRSVKLHATLEYLAFYWKDKLLSQYKHDPTVLNSLLDEIFLSLSIASKNGSKDLLNLIVGISEKQPNVLSCYLTKVLKSSSWIGMEKVAICPNEAKKIIQEWILRKHFQRSGSEYSLIDSYLQDLYHCSIAIEDGVDFVFHDFRR